METIKNKCVILKQKEYDLLLKKAEENKSKEIIIKYEIKYNIGKTYNNYCSGLIIEGDFVLSNKLIKQIYNILESWDMAHKNELLKILDEAEKKRKYIQDKANFDMIEIESNTRKNMIDFFKNLPWYKRLFFKTM